MHITLQEIDLKSLRFKVDDSKEVSQEPVKLEVSCRTVFLDKSRFAQNIKFIVSDSIDTPAYELIFEFETKFVFEENGKPSMKEFAYANAPAYVVAYARELITSITSRTSRIPTICLPPLNVFDLIKEGMHKDAEIFLDEKKHECLSEDEDNNQTEEIISEQNNL